MSIEEWVKQSRAEHRQKFGDIGLKKDCIHYRTKNGEDYCHATSYNNDSYVCLNCEKGVCYFYQSKED